MSDKTQAEHNESAHPPIADMKADFRSSLRSDRDRDANNVVVHKSTILHKSLTAVFWPLIVCIIYVRKWSDEWPGTDTPASARMANR